MRPRTIDYSGYTRAELEEAWIAVDDLRYPDNATEIYLRLLQFAEPQEADDESVNAFQNLEMALGFGLNHARPELFASLFGKLQPLIVKLGSISAAFNALQDVMHSTIETDLIFTNADLRDKEERVRAVIEARLTAEEN